MRAPLPAEVTTDQMKFKAHSFASDAVRRSSQRAGCALGAELRFFARWV
jgi:hypothetical protein